MLGFTYIQPNLLDYSTDRKCFLRDAETYDNTPYNRENRQTGKSRRDDMIIEKTNHNIQPRRGEIVRK